MNPDGDKWRKMVIGCIAGYFRQIDKYQDLAYVERLAIIKSTACRSAQFEDFNSIPLGKLRSIYNEFKHKQN